MDTQDTYYSSGTVSTPGVRLSVKQVPMGCGSTPSVPTDSLHGLLTESKLAVNQKNEGSIPSCAAKVIDLAAWKNKKRLNAAQSNVSLMVEQDPLKVTVEGSTPLRSTFSQMAHYTREQILSMLVFLGKHTPPEPPPSGGPASAWPLAA